MRHERRLSIAAVAVLAAVAALPGRAAAQARTVDVAIALAADVSRSIDDEEFELQRKGYAAALTSPQFVQAIQSGVHGAVALCFIEWAGPGQQALVARWMVIRDGEGATDFAKMLLAAPRSFAGRTAIGDGIDFASAQLAAGNIAATRRVIDVSGDGTNNSGRPVTAARDDVTAKGVTINGLAIINEKTGGIQGTFLFGHTHPPGGLPNYYHDNVIGGPGAFVLQISNFETFAQAMTNKLLTEISDATPHGLRQPAAPQTRKLRSIE
jgi:hypothetical protein